MSFESDYSLSAAAAAGAVGTVAAGDGSTARNADYTSSAAASPLPPPDIASPSTAAGTVASPSIAAAAAVAVAVHWNLRRSFLKNLSELPLPQAVYYRERERERVEVPGRKNQASKRRKEREVKVGLEINKGRSIMDLGWICIENLVRGPPITSLYHFSYPTLIMIIIRLDRKLQPLI